MRKYDPTGTTVYPRKTEGVRLRGVVLSYDPDMIFGYRVKWDDGIMEYLKPGEFMFVPPERQTQYA